MTSDQTKRCATCRFAASPRSGNPAEEALIIFDYDAADVPVQRPVPFMTCTRVIHGNKYRYSEAMQAKPEAAMVVDGSGYAARLVVLPTFGCVLHEVKP